MFWLEGLRCLAMGGRAVGMVVPGQMGRGSAGIPSGFGCRLLAYDPAPDRGLPALGGRYVELPELLSGADAITLHCPPAPATRHMIVAHAVAMMKPGLMLITTSSVAVLGMAARLAGHQSAQIGFLGRDGFEDQAGSFFERLSANMINSDEI